MAKVGEITISEARAIAPRLKLSSGTVTLTIKRDGVTLWTLTFTGDTTHSMKLDVVNVAGTLSPDVTGLYKWDTTVNGKDAYRQVVPADDGAWLIKFNTVIYQILQETE